MTQICVMRKNQGLIEEKDSRGYTNQFLLDRYHTEVLITGYDVKRRAAVIKRWFDLESGAATPAHQKTAQFQVPQTMAEALRLAADENEGRLKAEQQALEYKGQSEQYQKQVEHGRRSTIQMPIKYGRI